LEPLRTDIRKGEIVRFVIQAAGGMNVRAHPERFSAVALTVAVVHDPSRVAHTGAQFGTLGQNLPTPLGLGVEELFFPTNSTAPGQAAADVLRLGRGPHQR
jgi:hypothetical protein